MCAIKRFVRPSPFVNVPDQYGATLLHLAVALGLIDIFEFLVDSGCDVN
jgi:ankyrin repeat protein